jgi:F420-non-reducing hydrogenase iron-sulfur subunit
MAMSASPDVVVNVCRNCIPAGARLPRQWQQDGVRVLIREVPCSGKTDAQYLLSALEGAGRGVYVVACPSGQCRLAQGNSRAELRIRTIRRLLAEIGIEPERAGLLHFSPNESADRLEQEIRDVVQHLCAMGPSPIEAGG